MFGKLFGKPKSGGPPPPSSSSSKPASQNTINALQNLTEREEQLEKRKGLLEKRIKDEEDKAKEFLKTKKKSQALMCLKKKKLLEQQMDQLDNLLLRLSEQKIMLEDTTTTMGVVSALKDATKASKQTMEAMNITNVDQIMDEIQETNEQFRMVQETMSQPTGAAAELDEDELARELAEMEAEELDKVLLEPAPVPTTAPAAAQGQAEHALPAAPKSKVAKTAEEKELEALMAEMQLAQ